MIDGYRIDTENFDVDLVHHWLSDESYWATGRSRETVELSIRNSLCLGAFAAGGEQVAFARAVTDWATFAWIADVYVASDHRGRGLGTWLVGDLCDRIRASGVNRLLLATADAHGIYAKFGFAGLARPERFMEIDLR
ncbi:GNAT family N-acetyltransferase [Rugosimonospora africana]|uniref:N-acetyltransferase n=1 Tax=Rugosimonospora africana TaxID=556532 RepID=A0A8J3VNK0_9ACTN|nr:N-acetyltransferase [Rugosimonospora africana]